MLGPILGAIGSIGGALIGADSQEDANTANWNQAMWQTQQNMAEAHNNRLFNQGEAATQRAWSHDEADAARQFSAAQAQRQMDFQERMSSTAWQRATGDLERAGLNPLLAYSQGGASSPGGAAGSSGIPSGSSASGTPGHAVAAGPQRALFDGDIGVHVARTVSDLMDAEQRRSVREPLAIIAEAAADVIKDLRKAIPQVSEDVSRAVMRIEDAIKSIDIRGSGAAVAKEAVKVVEDGVQTVREIVKGTSRSVQGAVGSAASAAATVRDQVKKAVDQVEDQVREIVHGKKGVEPPPSRGKIPREMQRQRVFEPAYRWRMQ